MKVLVANRGEIALRIMRTLRDMGVASVAVYSDADKDAPHVWAADEAVALGAPTSYLDMAAIFAAASKTGATAVHPGYGFLSQNAAFAAQTPAQGLVFIGPDPKAMIALGDKRASREVAEKAGVPVVPGAKECDTLEAARAAAEQLGFPILLKAAGGGGGKGMRRVDDFAGLADAYAAAKREAMNAFRDDRMLVEKYIFPARHVEVQVMGDGKHAVALGERECSLQRRYQKIIEESPSPGITEAQRQQLCASAVKLLEAVGYANAGTVEFLVGPSGDHYFLEVNTRLQVEHPVTEILTGLDLVQCQIEIAHGGRLPTPRAPRGHAIEARLNAEDTAQGFLPATGEVLHLEWPLRPGLRIDSGIRQGSVVSPYYDSMLAKVIAWGETREVARQRLLMSLYETTLLGLPTNQSFLIDVLERDFFRSGATYTTTIESETWRPRMPSEAWQAIMQLAADKAKPTRTNVTAHPASAADAYSPWTTLGAFRMGQCG